MPLLVTSPDQFFIFKVPTAPGSTIFITEDTDLYDMIMYVSMKYGLNFCKYVVLDISYSFEKIRGGVHLEPAGISYVSPGAGQQAGGSAA